MLGIVTPCPDRVVTMAYFLTFMNLFHYFYVRVWFQPLHRYGTESVKPSPVGFGLERSHFSVVISFTINMNTPSNRLSQVLSWATPSGSMLHEKSLEDHFWILPVFAIRMQLVPCSSQKLQRSYQATLGVKGGVEKLWAVPFSRPEQKNTHYKGLRGRCQQKYTFFSSILIYGYFLYIKRQNKTQNLTFHIAQPFQNHHPADPTEAPHSCVSFLSLVFFPLIDHKNLDEVKGIPREQRAPVQYNFLLKFYIAKIIQQTFMCQDFLY